MSEPTVPYGAICYDLDTVSRFCRSTALAITMQKRTQTEWVTYRGSAVLNAIYSVLFWKEPPGTMEIRMANREQVDEDTSALQEQMLSSWIRKVHQQGPAVGKAYLESLASLREYSRSALAELFRDVREVNQMVANETRDAIRNLAAIKLGATVTVAGLGAGGAIVLTGGGAILCSAVATGYSATCSLIKSWDQGDSAKAVGIELGKAGASEALGKVAEGQAKAALGNVARQEQILASAAGQIRKYSEWFTREGMKASHLRKARNIVAASTAQSEVAKQSMAASARTARIAGAAKVGVPVLFAAWDIFEGFKEYDETVRGL